MASPWHDIILVKRSLRAIVAWLTIFTMVTATEVAEAGPFRDFFRELRSAFAHPDQKPRPHRSSHKHNESPPSDASNSDTSSSPVPASSPVPLGSSVPSSPGEREVRMAKA